MRIRKSSSSLKPPSSGTAAGAGSVASFSLFSAVSMRHYFNRLAGNRPLYRCSNDGWSCGEFGVSGAGSESAQIDVCLGGTCLRLHRQHDLAKVLAPFEIALGRPGFRQGKGFADHDLKLLLLNQLENRVELP